MQYPRGASVLFSPHLGRIFWAIGCGIFITLLFLRPLLPFLREIIIYFVFLSFYFPLVSSRRNLFLLLSALLLLRLRSPLVFIDTTNNLDAVGETRDYAIVRACRPLSSFQVFHLRNLSCLSRSAPFTLPSPSPQRHIIHAAALDLIVTGLHLQNLQYHMYSTSRRNRTPIPIVVVVRVPSAITPLPAGLDDRPPISITISA